MNEQQNVFWFAPLGLLAILIALALLIAAGPTLGGGFAEVHLALRGWLIDGDRAVADRATPASVQWRPGAEQAVLPTPAPVASSIPPSTTLSLASGEPCRGFSFSGALNVQGGRVTFGRFNLVSRTLPGEDQDPLASWKLIQFDGFSLNAERARVGWPTAIAVDERVNMLVADPFTGDMLFSARWQIRDVEVWGRNASTNSQLEVNLSDIRVNNAINSPALASFVAADRGILTMSIAHTGDIMAALAAQEPIYAAIAGTVHPERCIR